MEDSNPARRRKPSQRVSIFVADEESKRSSSGRDDRREVESIASRQTGHGSISRKHRQGSRASGSRGFSKPTKKKRQGTSIEFVRQESDPVVSRIRTGESWLHRLWKHLTNGIIEPIHLTYEEAYVYRLQSWGSYWIHLILVLVVIYGTFDLEHNYYSIIVNDLITRSRFYSNFSHRAIQFKEIRAPPCIWEFIREVIFKLIYPIQTTNNTHNSILQDNILIGVPQIRQVRVRNETCDTAPFFEKLYKSCYGEFSEENEYKEPFGLSSSRPWTYSYNYEKYSPGVINTYPGHGYAMNFTQDFEMTKRMLQELENNSWIRLGTRAIFLDFTMYAPNKNAFLMVKMVFEMLPSGGVFPSLNLYNVKLTGSRKDAQGYAFFGCYIFLLIYTVGLNSVLVMKLRRYGMKMMLTFPYIIDAVIILFTYTTFSYDIFMQVLVKNRLPGMVAMVNTSEHPTCGRFIKMFNHYHRAASILLLCIFVKLTVYFKWFNTTCQRLSCAVKKVKLELLCFTLMTLSVLFGFSFITCLAYGQTYKGAMSLKGSMISLILMHGKAFLIFGQVTRTAGRPIIMLLSIMGPLVTWYVKCISCPTFTALMVHGWELASDDCPMNQDPVRIRAYDIPTHRLILILAKLKLYVISNKLQEFQIIKMNEDDFFAFTHILHRYGWKHLEIRLLLKKYGIRKGDDLTIDELFEVYQDFWVRNLLVFAVQQNNKVLRDLEKVRVRVEHSESAMRDMKSKVEMLMDRILDTARASTSSPRTPTRPSVRRFW